MSGNERRQGVLLHISSLPSPYGIGDIGKCAYKFLDLLESMGCTLWQILPINITDEYNSPYRSYSAFAGNPYFIDLDALILEGYLTDADLQGLDFGISKSRVDYKKVAASKDKIFKRVYESFQRNTPPSFHSFCEENKEWLNTFSLFMAVKEETCKKFENFPESIKRREKSALESCEKELYHKITYHKMLQYFFFKQMKKLKLYANKKGIKLIGDIPIYVSSDSADVWGNPELFQLDENLNPTALAGCPPDKFSQDGQLWGNPLYDWEYMKETGYKWWKDRIAHTLSYCDILRIDHFRGLESYYAIPPQSQNARVGEWRKGGGKAFISSLKENFKKDQIIAEDLGFLTKEVEELLSFSGFSGMKILQFGFSEGSESPHLPHNHKKNSVVYTGTHDNPTLKEWISTLNDEELKFLLKYLNCKEDELRNKLLLAAMSSPSKYSIIPFQDILGLGGSARMNTPGTTKNNWVWRLESLKIDDEIIEFFKTYTEIFGRNNPHKKGV